MPEKYGYLRKALKREKLKQSAKLDILNHITVMFGLPGQTYESSLKTISTNG